MSDRDEFEAWWHNEGSGINCRDGDDFESHALRVARESWGASRRWRPISEAPKDSECLVSDGVDCMVGYFEWTDDDGMDHWTSSNCIDQYYGFIPTHWQPLPNKPPTGAAQ